MPRVFRQQYTRSIPAGAVRVTIKDKKGNAVPAVRFKDAGGKAVVAPLTKTGDRCRVSSPVWYGHIDGERVPLCENKAAAEMMLSDLVKKAELGKLGVCDPFEAHRGKPLAEHLADFEAEHRSGALNKKRRKPPSAEQVSRTIARIRRVLNGCGFRLASEITLAAVQDFLSSLSTDSPSPTLSKAEYTRKELAVLLGVKPGAVGPLVRRHNLTAIGNGKARRYPLATAEALLFRATQGVGAATSGYYAREVKFFTGWLAKRKRVEADPLADLPGATTESDHRRDRRSLTEDELRRLLTAAKDSAEVFRGLDGRDRFHLYLVAMASGFRAAELACLTPSSFALDDLATVSLRPEQTKNGKAAEQPLPEDVAAAMRIYLEGKTGLVWPGTWAERAADMMRPDLATAGIPFVVEGPEGPLYADFHALRHSFVALLDKAGASLKVAMHLARHSDPKLTMARYGKPRAHDLAAAVDRLPSLTPKATAAPAEARATGTEGGRTTPKADTKLDFPYTLLTQTSDSERGESMPNEDREKAGRALPSRSNSLIPQVFDAERGELRTGEDTGPSRIRTCNQGIMREQDADSSPLPAKDLRADGESLTRCLHENADPDLSRVALAWPTLPHHIRAAVLALVDAAAK